MDRSLFGWVDVAFEKVPLLPSGSHMSCTHGVFFFLWSLRCCAGRAPSTGRARQGMRPGPPTRSGRRCSPARGCSSRSSSEPWSRLHSPEVWPHSHTLRSCVGMELGKAMQGKCWECPVTPRTHALSFSLDGSSRKKMNSTRCFSATNAAATCSPISWLVHSETATGPDYRGVWGYL
jgi:hypothetical protein